MLFHYKIHTNKTIEIVLCHVLFHYEIHAVTKVQGCSDFYLLFLIITCTDLLVCDTAVKGSYWPVVSELTEKLYVVQEADNNVPNIKINQAIFIKTTSQDVESSTQP